MIFEDLDQECKSLNNINIKSLGSSAKEFIALCHARAYIAFHLLRFKNLIIIL